MWSKKKRLNIWSFHAKSTPKGAGRKQTNLRGVCGIGVCRVAHCPPLVEACDTCWPWNVANKQ